MKHFICKGGCGGESKEQGVCGDKDCRDFEKSMHECDCTDSQHDKACLCCLTGKK